MALAINSLPDPLSPVINTLQALFDYIHYRWIIIHNQNLQTSIIRRVYVRHCFPHEQLGKTKVSPGKIAVGAPSCCAEFYLVKDSKSSVQDMVLQQLPLVS